MCVSENESVLSVAEEKHPKTHANVISFLIDSALRKADCNSNDLDAVSVSKGPGSYTGLRIGVSAAKGICYALSKPLISVSSILSMAAYFKSTRISHDVPAGERIVFVPLIDAKRMEVYSAVVDFKLNFLTEPKAELLTENSFLFLEDAFDTIYFFGDGCVKLKKLNSNIKKAIFVESFLPSSCGMAPFSFRSIQERNFENLAYFEPFYLKDFISQSTKI